MGEKALAEAYLPGFFKKRVSAPCPLQRRVDRWETNVVALQRGPGGTRALRRREGALAQEWRRTPSSGR